MKLCVLGDIHGHWGPEDVAQIDALGYDAVLVVGDLGGYRFQGTLTVARGLAALRTPMLLLPGNHDATHMASLVAEATGQALLHGLAPRDVVGRVQQLALAIGPHTLAAYGRFDLGGVTVIAGRPHSMGGPGLAFATQLAQNWGVDSLAASTERLCALVDDSEGPLVFLAHNGPHGLGEAPDDIWGCDFKRDGGDWGDRDLTAAIAHARTQGRTVLAVVAGHMHRRTRGGAQRTWQVQRQGTLYVNAAQVPRVKDATRHHVCLEIKGESAFATDVFLPSQ